MTLALSGQEVAGLISAQFPGAVVDSNNFAVVLNSESLIQVAGFLKTNPDHLYNYLSDITSVDYLDYFEVVYRLTSIEHNRSLVLKTRCYNRENPVVPSITCLWKGANFMEREIFDLMGISFSGHPEMKRIFLWEGFKGNPLRKDYL
jgi:NADH-quinone oxidoreductase subunit C